MIGGIQRLSRMKGKTMDSERHKAKTIGDRKGQRDNLLYERGTGVPTAKLMKTTKKKQALQSCSFQHSFAGHLAYLFKK